ncbi:hypothetical protein T484DRAFT_1801941 [Baffinella frigidus]|nr:hypothetical protein T484DRAFT_1801941 [Cryptophyta sp. CCMP2293]
MASSNWRYMGEEEGLNRPRKDEHTMDTTYARKKFDLAASDIQKIQGFRPEGRRGVRTIYYVADLTALAITTHGQDKFDTRVPYGRELSGRHGSFADEVREAKREAAAALKAEKASARKELALAMGGGGAVAGHKRALDETVWGSGGGESGAAGGLLSPSLSSAKTSLPPSLSGASGLALSPSLSSAKTTPEAGAKKSKQASITAFFGAGGGAAAGGSCIVLD